jgi:motility quorum-sensing regulator/GCU-specific mRNA interferase toxin
MEKRKPHCPLAVALAMVADGKVRATQSALSGAAAMGLDYSAMIEVVQLLEMGDFYKSMTTRNDHRVWQDVYRPVTEYGAIYMKLTVIDDVVIISFKEQ